MRKLLRLTACVCALLVMAAPLSARQEETDDQAIAEKAVLRASDLPDGWEADEDVDADEEDPAEGQVPECEDLEAQLEKGDDVPNAESGEFDDGDDPDGVASVSNEVFVFPKAKGAKRYLAPFAREGADCLLGRAELIPRVVDAEVEELDVEAFGTDGAGYTVLATLESNDRESVFALDLVVVRVGRGIVRFAAENLDEPLPIGPDLLEAVTDRLEEALQRFRNPRRLAGRDMRVGEGL